MAVSQVAEATAARLADRAGSGGLAVIRTVSLAEMCTAS